MDPKVDQVWLTQKLVQALRGEVARKEAELSMLIAHKARLLQAFSMPTFPPGYVPSDGLFDSVTEQHNRHGERSELGPSSTTDMAGQSAKFNQGKGKNVPYPVQEISPPQSSPPADCVTPAEVASPSFSTSDASEDHERGRKKGVNAATLTPQSSGSEDSSRSSEGKILNSPVAKAMRSRSKFPVVNWTDQIRSRSAADLSGDSSSETESISSEGTADKGRSVYVEQSNAKKNATSAAGFAKAATQVSGLSTEAPPEDQFDWEVLAFSGPWSQGMSSCLLADSPWSQLHQRRQASLPCKFETMDEYKSKFQGLIFEECKASLSSSWEGLQKPQVVESRQTVHEVQDRGQANLWQFRPMYPSADDPFNYVEAEVIKGPLVRLDTSELVLLTYEDIKVLAIVNLTNNKSVLLRTRVGLQASDGQCELLRMTNLVTLKRQYISLCKASEIWDPLQQQLLDPLQGCNFLVSPPSETCLEEDVKVSTCLDTLLAWRDQGKFNNRQVVAIDGLLQLKQGFLLVQGPPGTGKTSTIVGMISAVHIEEPRARILVCASSNAAVDEIVSRLMHQMLDQAGNYFTPERGNLVRLGIEKSINGVCLPVSLDNLLQGTSMAAKSANARSDTLAAALVVCSTISGSGHQVFEEVNQKFDLLIIDEAAQALESEVLIALQRVKGRCVLVGDPCQLPAVVLQKPGIAYGRSLFERMQQAGRPVFLMATQYRMHPYISQFPSAQFYGGRLKDSRESHTMLPIFTDKARKMGIDICGCKVKLGAYCFLDVTWGVEQGEVVGYSISNVEEAEVVAAVVQGVVRSLKHGREPNIGVITPYLAQRSVIMKNLEEHGVFEKACEVNTVDGFQGREKDVIILSCVRAQTESGLGFVNDTRRMNVALTRARHCLIIIGHAETLQRQSSPWSALLENASARGFYQVLCHRPRMEINGNNKGKQRPDAAKRIGPSQRSDQGATADIRMKQHSMHANSNQGGRAGIGCHQGTNATSGTVQPAGQARVERGGSSIATRNGSSIATRNVEHPNHIRFEEEADDNDTRFNEEEEINHTRSQQGTNASVSIKPLESASMVEQHLSGISNQSSGKQANFKRKAEQYDTGGHFEKSDDRQRRKVKKVTASKVKQPLPNMPEEFRSKEVKLEQEAQYGMSSKNKGIPPPKQIRGQRRGNRNECDGYNAMPHLKDTVKEEVVIGQDFRYYDNGEGSRSEVLLVNAGPSFGRYQNLIRKIGEDRRVGSPKNCDGRGSRDSGRYVLGFERDHNPVVDKQERQVSWHGNRHSKESGRFSGKRGGKGRQFHGSKARQGRF